MPQISGDQRFSPILERKGLKLRGYGHADLVGPDAALDNFAARQWSIKEELPLMTLERAISINEIVVVAVAWQTTWEILRDIRHATVGHYMVWWGSISRRPVDLLKPGLAAKRRGYPLIFR